MSKTKSNKQYKSHLASTYKTKYNTKYNTKKTNSNTNNNPNTNIIHILTLVKNYYNSLRNTIHVNAYERAIYQISKWGKPITAGKELSHLEGIGKGMIEKIDTIIKTGTLPIVIEKHLDTQTLQHTKTKSSLDTIHILGFGEKLANELKSKYNARTINDVRKLVANNKIKLTHTQTIGLKYYEDLNTIIPRNEITEIGDKIKQIITNNTNTSNNKQYNVNVFLAGSYPSGLKEESKDIDILIVGDPKCVSLKNMVEDISRVMMLETLSLGSTKFLGIIKNKNDDTTTAKWRHLDMRFVNAESFPYAWLYYSSGKIFNKMIREKLKKKGYKLNEWGLYHSNSNKNSNNKKMDLGEDINKYINISLDTKTKCDVRLKDEDLIEYKDVIEKKIFEKAGMEYKNVKERY
jgi:DNA polymerase/3'-5' exonuclease PolX